MRLKTFVSIAIMCWVLLYVGKIKIQNKELLPHGGTAQFLCTLTFAGFLFGVILFYVGYFHKKGYLISPTEEGGIHLLAFFIVSANIIYWLYQIRNKNLHALAQYIAVLFLIIMVFFVCLLLPYF